MEFIKSFLGVEQHVFQSIEPFITRPKTTGRHVPFFVTPLFFETNKITSWNGNRPHDEKRVTELAEYMNCEKRCPGVVCLAMLEGELVCYDGNHRRLALSDQVPFVIVDIMFDANDELIMKEFNNINKSVSVPEIYVDQSSSKEEIEHWVAYFCKKYHARMSTSMKCQKPNFNRDLLTQNVYDLQKDLECDTGTLLRHLEKLNTLYANDKTGRKMDKKSLSVQVLDGCKTSGLWLFAKSRTIPLGDVKKVADGKWK